MAEEVTVFRKDGKKYTRCQRPSYRYNRNYQFITGYTGGGAEECVHLSKEEISFRLAKQSGPGELYDDGINLWWMQDEKTVETHI